VTMLLIGLFDTLGGRTRVRPPFDREVVDRVLELDDQRADLLRREAGILGDETREGWQVDQRQQDCRPEAHSSNGSSERERSLLY